MKKAIIALLAFGALSTAAIPAKADTANVLDSVQTTDTTGSGNHVRQGSTQDVNNRSRNAHDNTGSSVSSDQYSGTTGHGNDVQVDNVQRVNNDSARTRPSRRSR